MSTPVAVHLDSVNTYYEAACRLLCGISTICGELRYLQIAVKDRLLRNHHGAGISPWTLDIYDRGDDVAEITVALLSESAERLAELKQVLHRLKASDIMLAAFAQDSCPLWMRPARGVANCLAGKFLKDQRQKPRASCHATLIDLAAGCLDEFSIAVADPKAAARVAEQWSEVFFELGGTWQQWILGLCAEKARAKEPHGDLTEDEKRQRFCFESWQEGRSYKEINANLEKNPKWTCFTNEKAVRGPINAWSKRIGVEPRTGQRGWRKSIAQPR